MADEKVRKLNEEAKSRKLTIIQQEYMNYIEKRNAERVVDLKRIRRNNRITGLILGGTALGIYAYSIYAVSQERFLDDFDEPEKTTE